MTVKIFKGENAILKHLETEIQKQTKCDLKYIPKSNVRRQPSIHPTLREEDYAIHDKTIVCVQRER